VVGWGSFSVSHLSAFGASIWAPVPRQLIFHCAANLFRVFLTVEGSVSTYTTATFVNAVVYTVGISETKYYIAIKDTGHS